MFIPAPIESDGTVFALCIFNFSFSSSDPVSFSQSKSFAYLLTPSFTNICVRALPANDPTLFNVGVQLLPTFLGASDKSSIALGVGVGAGGVGSAILVISSKSIGCGLPLTPGFE